MSITISNMTESEFLSFVKMICEADYPTEEEHTKAVITFEEISEHPSGSDLIFYPHKNKEGAEAVVLEVKTWRAANGRSGFKPT